MRRHDSRGARPRGSGRARGLALGALVVTGALGACHHHDPEARATVSPDAADASVAAKNAPRDAGADAPRGHGELAVDLPWYEAVRARSWDEAYRAIAKLPDGERHKPEVRLAHARVCLELGKYAEAKELLAGLEDALPLVRDIITDARAEAELHEGPLEDAAKHFAAEHDVHAWVVSAKAWADAKEPGRARAQCDRVIGAKKASRADEEAARALRMRLVRAKKGDAAAKTDAKWLAIHAFDEELASESAALLAKLHAPLDAKDWLERAHDLAEAGSSSEALRAVARAADAKGRASKVTLCRARAEAYYEDQARARYPEAALEYRKCAAMGGAHVAEDRFLSARAFSRANRDADALAAFAVVMKKHPRTRWAEQAEVHIARIHALAGRWKDATRAFDAYVKRWPHGSQRRWAARYRALAHLMAGDHGVARKLLGDLAGNASSSLERARWTNLAALAAMRDGDRVHAVAQWTQVARAHPLTWPALVARARLAEAHAPLPLTIDPPATTDEPPSPLKIALPAPAAMLHAIGFDAAAERALRSRERVVANAKPGRGTESVCAAYAKLDRGKRRYRASFRVPNELLASAPGPVNRWAWDCRFPRPHKSAVRTAAARAHISPDLVWAVMRQESGFDPVVVSPARAVGLMQLLPETARAVAKSAKIPHEDDDLTRPAHNITLGALYLREVLNELGGQTALAVAAYNAGPEAVGRWKGHASGETLDVFVEAIPYVETRAYVARVMGNLARYGYLERGEAGVPKLDLALK